MEAATIVLYLRDRRPQTTFRVSNLAIYSKTPTLVFLRLKGTL